MKKFVIAIVGIVGLLVIASQVFKAQIGERLFKRMVETRMSAVPMADLPDGLHAVLIGTGSPLADPSRAGPSTAIIAGRQIFIVDSGGGSVRKMGRFGVPPGRVDGVFLTHFHSDHIDGLGELMLQRWVNRRANAPLPVYGPEGVDDVIAGLNLAYAQDRDYRIVHHGEAIVPPSGFGGIAQSFSGDAARIIFEKDGLTVTAFPVHHEPIEPAVGYRFDYKGRSISLTGDTAASPDLAGPIDGSNLLISEALNKDMVKFMETTAGERGAKSVSKIMADIQDYHISPVEAAKLAQETGTDMLVYSHIVPILPTRYLDAYFTQGTADVFNGEIIVGQDGMMFSLPAGSTAITKR